ncbi:MAG: aconitase X catalytic domain-containing protein [Burkholderiales bacterium]
MRLTDEQQAMLDGTRGWPMQVAMRLLVAVGRALDADGLVPVASVHLSLSGVSVGEPGRRFYEDLVARGGRFVVPTTLNVLSLDRREGGRDPALAANESKQLAIVRACEAMGGTPIYTCNPFLHGVVPRAGESVAWNESATAPYVNGVLGARTNREGATALASALTGFTARYGMHVDSARRGGIGIEVATPVEGSDAFAVLGGAVGRIAGARVPVLGGLARVPTFDEYTAFCAAYAAVGPGAIFHIVGMTPEAPDRLPPGPEGGAPARIDAQVLAREVRAHSTARGERVDVVAVGCPHASIEQLREIVACVGGRRVHAGTRFVVQTSAATARAAEEEGIGHALREAGVTLTADTCVHIAYRQAPAGAVLATNSLKIAYLTGSHDVGVRFGPLAACVDAATSGRWTAAS